MRYKLTSPSGWYFYQPVYETGRITLLIPNGETKESSKRFIYALDVPFEPGYETVEQVVRDDVDSTNSKGIFVKVLHDSIITTNGGVEARIIYFSPFVMKGDTNWQANAYLGNGTGCLKISLATDNASAFTKHIPDFEFVVKSYVFLESWGWKQE
ncbi:MAG: hypothetical protein IPO24_18875 [Bacteroidetes bacterium]|nr:hypothetical protein [Bacteroidota bacterium]